MDLVKALGNIFILFISISNTEPELIRHVPGNDFILLEKRSRYRYGSAQIILVPVKLWRTIRTPRFGRPVVVQIGIPAETSLLQSLRELTSPEKLNIVIASTRARAFARDRTHRLPDSITKAGRQ